MDKETATDRFAAKRQEIIDEASRSINLHGVAGLSSTEVAEAVGLTHNSLKYYFKRKNDLIFACFDQTFDRLESMLRPAAALPSREERVVRFIDICFSRIADIAAGTAGRFLRIADIQAISEPERSILIGRFDANIGKIATLFDDGKNDRDEQVRAHLLWELTRSLAFWLPLHDRREYRRLKARFIPMLTMGFASIGPVATRPLSYKPVLCDPTVENYLKAAIKVINEVGYRGASVTKIASEINVTKGGFYHHLDTKLDVLQECFDRTFQLLDNILDAAEDLDASGLEKLLCIARTIFEIQLSGSEPLLRIPSLYASPPGILQAIADRINKTTLRLAGFFSDGMMDGSMPTVDPIIGSHIILSLLNASYEISDNLPSLDQPAMMSDCIRLTFNGLLSR